MHKEQAPKRNRKISRELKDYVLPRKRRVIAFLILVAAIPLILITACYVIVNDNERYLTESPPYSKVGLVLGAGITPEGKPYKELQARLDVAADALQSGKVDKLILSGDNRFYEYNEPDAMRDYLVQSRGVPADRLQPDYAGRSTYESCERAAKVFQVKQLTIFSASSHVPRAIYLCRHFGIESHGVGSKLEANNSTRREALARVKAVYNVYVRGEPTVLGSPIPLE